MKAMNVILVLLSALGLAPAAVFCASSALGPSIAVNKFVTPNGDNRNDTFIFRCYNPRDYAVEGRVYDLSGREVAVMRLKQRSNGTDPAITVDNSAGIYYDLEWNPNSGGHKPGGVYIYQVRMETKVYKGTIVVIR